MKSGAIFILVSAAVCGQSSQTQPPPDSPQRTIRDASAFKSGEPPKPPPKVDPVKAVLPESARPVPTRTFDSLDSSTENLNVIRDANLRRLLKNGCAPAVSARMAELRTRLDLPAEKTEHPARPGSKPEASATELASGWYKAPPAAANTASANKSADLLDGVLPVAKTDVPAKKASESDAAALKIELDQLLAACPGAK